MKRLAALLITVMALAQLSHSQDVNWRSLHEDQQNVVQLSMGYDYGATMQLGYSRALNSFRPILIGLDYSFPMGNQPLDDFKVRLGGQIEVVQIGGFSATVKILSNFRRYENALVTIVSFGSDLGLLAGYYKPTWYAAGEFGFDKSIVAQLKHSDIMKSNFPGIRDGWYIPMGGHYYYGIQGGKTIGESLDLTLRVGMTLAQFDDENAVLPYYAQLGLDMRF